MRSACSPIVLIAKSWAGWKKSTCWRPRCSTTSISEALYAATARNIADSQKQEGPTRAGCAEIAPQYVVFGVDNGIFDDSPEWGSTAVLAPWYVYQRDGDRAALLSQLEVMRRYVDYLSSRAETTSSLTAWATGTT